MEICIFSLIFPHVKYIILVFVAENLKCHFLVFYLAYGTFFTICSMFLSSYVLWCTLRSVFLCLCALCAFFRPLQPASTTDWLNCYLADGLIIGGCRWLVVDHWMSRLPVLKRRVERGKQKDSEESERMRNKKLVGVNIGYVVYLSACLLTAHLYWFT